MKIIKTVHNTLHLLSFFIIILAFYKTSHAQNSALENSWEQKADSVVLYAKSQIGVTYIWGTCKPGKSFDCSGFTYYVYNKLGIKSSRSATSYGKYGRSIPLKKCRKGDCILFTGTQPSDKSIGHIGIIISNKEDQLYFIHCSSSTRHFGVVITEYYSSNYPKRFIETRRLFE